MRNLFALLGSFGISATFLIGGETLAATLTVCPAGCQYSSIQGAIDSAQNGDSISIQQGHYVENISTEGKQLYLNGVNSRQAIIDGGHKGPVVTVPYGVVVISGVTIMNGVGSESAGSGGGITSYAEALTVSHSTIINNTSEVGGGGIFESTGSGVPGALITISSCTITNNDAATGAGVLLSMEGGSAVVVDSTIARNGHSGTSGGGIMAGDGVTVTITGTSIVDNAGGGIWVESFLFAPTLTIENSSIAGNAWSSNGGGILSNGYSVVLRNVGLTRNSGANGGGIYVTPYNSHIATNATADLVDVYVVGNTATVDGGGTYLGTPVVAADVVNVGNHPDNCGKFSECP